MESNSEFKAILEQMMKDRIKVSILEDDIRRIKNEIQQLKDKIVILQKTKVDKIFTESK